MLRCVTVAQRSQHLEKDQEWNQERNAMPVVLIPHRFEKFDDGLMTDYHFGCTKSCLITAEQHNKLCP